MLNYTRTNLLFKGGVVPVSAGHSASPANSMQTCRSLLSYYRWKSLRPFVVVELQNVAYIPPINAVSVVMVAAGLHGCPRAVPFVQACEVKLGREEGHNDRQPGSKDVTILVMILRRLSTF